MLNRIVTPVVSAAVLSASAFALAQTTTTTPQPTAPTGAAASATAQQGGEQSMQKLQQAADHLRESIQAMAQKPAGADRQRALDQAHEALLETQRAMVALPADARGTRVVSDAQYERSVSQLMKAADDLRQSIQAMAQRPAGEQRHQAIESAREALWDTQQAMISAYDPDAATRTMGAGAQPRTDVAAADTRTAGAAGATVQRETVEQRVRADRN